jgi:hypothetical protein
MAPRDQVTWLAIIAATPLSTTNAITDTRIKFDRPKTRIFATLTLCWRMDEHARISDTAKKDIHATVQICQGTSP